MSIASIGQKFLIACKYSAIVMLLMMWSGFTGFLGFLVSAMLGGSNFTQYTAAAIGALAGLVFIIGLLQLDIEKKRPSQES